ncbi:hypothetical protein C8J56DRAFT_1158108 [Mycena floridula]|nr:hypothetical protein C8J56DRAFT_1158108 [Mycena floridula]
MHFSILCLTAVTFTFAAAAPHPMLPASNLAIRSDSHILVQRDPTLVARTGEPPKSDNDFWKNPKLLAICPHCRMRRYDDNTVHDCINRHAARGGEYMKKKQEEREAKRKESQANGSGSGELNSEDE